MLTTTNRSNQTLTSCDPNVEKSELWVYKRQGDEGMDAGDGPPSESDHKKKVAAFIIEARDPQWHIYECWLA